MFCTRCGKKIDYDALVCNECLMQEAVANAPAEEEVAAPVLENTENVATDTEEPAYTTAQEPVNPQPTYTAPNNQQYYYNQNAYQNNAYQNPAYTPYTTYQQPQPAATTGNPRMFGFGKALASSILGFSAYLFSAFTLGFSESGLGGATIILLMMTLGMAIPSLVMGIRSIKTFTGAPKQGLPRPIATLVLGICGLSFAAIALFISFIALIAIGSYM